MSKIEYAKSYTGRDLETIFFRPIMTGPDANALGIKMMYNMPVPTTLQYWKRSSDILQKYTTSGWSGSTNSEKFQKTIKLSKVKAEIGYSADDYFARVYELITNRADVNLDDLSGTELEEAETALFKQAITESIRTTMWYGDTERSDEYSTFDGFLKNLVNDIIAGESILCTKIYDPLLVGSDAEKLLKDVWTKAPNELKGAKSQGNLVFLVTSDVYSMYEEALNEVQLESAYLAKQNGRDGLSYRGIPVVDLQLNNFNPSDYPTSFVLLTDRRNLAMAVNTADFPGTEIRMWYNPDQMENRQRAIFMAGCDYLLPEMVSMAIKHSDVTLTRTGVGLSGGAVSALFSTSYKMIDRVLACGLNASDAAAGTEITLTKNAGMYSGTIAGTNVTKVRFTIKYVNGTSVVIVK